MRAALALMVLVSLPSCGDRDADSPAARSGAGAPAARVWTAGMRATLSGAFCADAAYFRQCFEVGRDECVDRVQVAFDACVQVHASDIPSVPTAASGRRAGEKLGSCTGRRYELALTAEGRRRSHDPRCNDASNWVP